MQILAIGPHPDDIEIGCFGTLARHRAYGDSVSLLIMTNGEEGGGASVRRDEAVAGARVLGADISFGDLPDTLIPADGTTVQIVERLVQELNPDIVYLPSDKDRHQDHRNTSRAAQAATRRVRQVYMYETPSTLQQFAPQLFVDVTASYHYKPEALNCHRSQLERWVHLIEALEGLAVFRAYQAGFIGGKAEAFEVVRILR
jgi:LmbE family N-acetylglucosaminyl deacetylase